ICLALGAPARDGLLRRAEAIAGAPDARIAGDAFARIDADFERFPANLVLGGMNPGWLLSTVEAERDLHARLARARAAAEKRRSSRVTRASTGRIPRRRWMSPNPQSMPSSRGRVARGVRGPTGTRRAMCRPAATCPWRLSAYSCMWTHISVDRQATHEGPCG